jgi:carbon monoxide dehydrogenase subunit G
MRVEGERSFSASRETVWDVLNDPSKMAELMPGVESFDVQDDRHWSANVKIPLGLGGLRMSMKFDKVEERAPEYAKLDAKGTGVGAMLSMQTAFNLAEADGGGTTMKWEADVSIAGPVGAMGQRVLQPIVNQQVTNVLNALDKQVTAADAPGETPPAPEPTEGAGGAEEGISPLSPETYSEDPEGPTTSTEDPR